MENVADNYGLASLGNKPTFSGKNDVLEVYIFNFNKKNSEFFKNFLLVDLTFLLNLFFFIISPYFDKGLLYFEPKKIIKY